MGLPFRRASILSFASEGLIAASLTEVLLVRSVDFFEFAVLFEQGDDVQRRCTWMADHVWQEEPGACAGVRQPEIQQWHPVCLCEASDRFE